jgi:ParB-like chromosome segregation protein Spo0J
MWQWRPGSPPDGVPWSWAHEAADLIRREPDVMADLVLSVYENGVQEPVTLGYDGRVWDGHHRIVAALIAGRDTVPVDVYAEVMPS